MSTHLYVAPTSAGKTTWVIETVRQAAARLQHTPVVVVSTPLQALSLRRRLAQAGGALGVHVHTFEDLCAAILQAAHVIYTQLDEAVRYRLLRASVDELVDADRLPFYQTLAARPGFIAALESLVGEFKGADVRPEQLIEAWQAIGAPPRLTELAAVYAHYQGILEANQWTDRAGLGRLALDALAQAGTQLPTAWTPVIFDGFDSFTVVQRAVIAALAPRVSRLVVMLTGSTDAQGQGVFRLFDETAAQLAAQLNIPVTPLPDVALPATSRHALCPLAERLFVSEAGGDQVEAPVTLLAAANQAGEVRAALRWLKERIVVDGYKPAEVALLARSASVYRDHVAQVAAEFGLPIRFAGRLPLAQNPAVAALLDLLHLMLPDAATGALAASPDQPAAAPVANLRLPRRNVVEAWRSPYFDWGFAEDGPAIGERDADMLDAVARNYLVIRGLSQWREAFELYCARTAQEDGEDAGVLPAGEVAAGLAQRFERFVRCLTPPADACSLRDFACWLEELIGPDPAQVHTPAASDDAYGGFTLDMVARIREGDAALELRDIAALRGLKDVLRGLVWSEEVVVAARGKAPPADYVRFVAELVGAVAAATYQPPLAWEDTILMAELVAVQGVPFRAVAIVGLAEGELPKRRSEDPFLRNRDRAELRRQGLALEESTRSDEREAFYQALGRGREQLLLTRPRLADNGVAWEPSPYWQAVERLTGIKEVEVLAEFRPGLASVASRAELLESATRNAEVAAWLAVERPADLANLQRGAALVSARARRRRNTTSHFDGFLGDDAERVAGLLAHLQRWSLSRLERYRACPYWFYVASVLGLEARAEPEEGMNVAQIGNIYHHILEQIYRSGVDPTDAAALVDALPAVAAGVLDAAPAHEGFRVTAWWQQTRLEIEATVKKSLEAFAATGGVPVALEQRFAHERSLQIDYGEGTFRVTGVIDRVDRLPDGTLCIIDYKTGVSDYGNERSLRDGKRLQLPLYALAAREALHLGEVATGYYWFVRKAEPAGWTLADFKDPATGDTGPDAAIAVAVAYAVDAVRSARRGEFAPQPPDAGCPDYCPAAAFCWHYQPKYTG